MISSIKALINNSTKHFMQIGLNCLNQVQVYYFLTVSFNLTVSSEELKNHILFRLKLTEEQHVKQIKFKTFVVYKNEWLVPLTHMQIN